MTDELQPSLDDDERTGRGTSRRDLIKKAAIVGGAAWVAPTVLSMSAAGAQTVQCYSFKTTGACVCSPEADGGGTGCASGGAPYACPPAGVIQSISGCNTGRTFAITLRSGCTVQFLSIKYGSNCDTICSNGSGVDPECGTNQLSYTVPSNENSHINIRICCTS